MIDPSGRTVFVSQGSDDAAMQALRAAIVATLDAPSQGVSR